MKLSFHSGVLFWVVSLSSGHARTIDFVEEVKPILEAACVHCHNGQKRESQFSMTSREEFFQGGETYGEEVVRKGDPAKSRMLLMIALRSGNEEAMPPKKRLSRTQAGKLYDWISQGAKWPDGVVLRERARVTQNDVVRMLVKGTALSDNDRDRLRAWVEQGAPWDFPVSFQVEAVEQLRKEKDEKTLVKTIHDWVLSETTVEIEADMEAYKKVIPKSGVEYEMVPIPGGTFLMGSPPEEKDRKDDEGPQHERKIEPFWMGKYEITWDQFEPFMITKVQRSHDGTPQVVPDDAELVDIISSPTTPYTEMSFGMGTGTHPAVNMTQHSANKFCQWLSVQTGHFYRLPTEAEWEYACRAGTKTRYSFGDDPAKLNEYGVFWIEEEGIDKYEKVGTKKPNPWGLHDMHGNVLEWCLDQYYADAYREGERMTIPPQKLYPRVSRGGSWYDDAKDCRSASRFKSEGNWKAQDPELPKSMWYHTDALWQGFRIVRPLRIPSAREMYEAWNCGIEKWEPWGEE